MNSSQTILIRTATAGDADALEQLAALDSRRPLTGPAMIAEVDGTALVALDLHDGSVAADPFAHTAQLVEMLTSTYITRRGASARSSRSPSRAWSAAWSWSGRIVAGRASLAR